MPMNAWTVSGTIDLAPELAGKTGGSDVLYVMARVPGERMPLSVERYPAPAFPLAYRLRSGHGAGAADAPPAMEILARLSRAGTAGPPQPGDLEGTYDGTAAAGATGVDFVIDIEH
jgi:cytochrome c-type biogenesis protein CcmH